MFKKPFILHLTVFYLFLMKRKKMSKHLRIIIHFVFYYIEEKVYGYGDLHQHYFSAIHKERKYIVLRGCNQ